MTYFLFLNLIPFFTLPTSDNSTRTSFLRKQGIAPGTAEGVA